MADPVQWKAASGTEPFSMSFTTLPGVGRTLQIVLFGWSGTVTFTPSLSDNQTGNSYVQRRFNHDTNTYGSWVVEFDIVSVVGSSGTFTLTFNTGLTAGTSAVLMAIVETANRAADAGAAASANSTAPAPGSVTPTDTADFAVTSVANSDSSPTATLTSPGSPWVSMLKSTDGTGSIVGELMYANLASAAAINPTWTTGAFVWEAEQQLYKAAAAAGGLPEGWEEWDFPALMRIRRDNRQLVPWE